jgi:hypothetical protein
MHGHDCYGEGKRCGYNKELLLFVGWVTISLESTDVPELKLRQE